MTVPEFVSRLRADEWIIIRGAFGRPQLAQVLPTSDTVRRNGGVKVWKFIETLHRPSRFSDPMRIPFIDVLRRPATPHDLAAVKRAELHQSRAVEFTGKPDTPESVAEKARAARRVGELFRDALRDREPQ